MKVKLLLILVLSLASLSVRSQTIDEMNASNDPLTPAFGLNIQDYYTASYFSLPTATSNTYLLRGVLPHRLFSAPMLLRASLPIVSQYYANYSQTGLGDLNIFDMFLLSSGSTELGIGPQLTIPTATKDGTGTGKWQAGLVASAVTPEIWGIFGALITWQHSFAGSEDRTEQNNLQVQPLLVCNITEGWYLRSSGIWTWSLELSTYFIPIGVGAGKVWKGEGATYNFFVEPQLSVAHNGVVPNIQVFAGFNMQFH